MSDDLRKASKRKVNFGQTAKAVLWGMFGVRRGAGYEEDTSSLNPVHVIIAAVIAVLVLVLVLILIARWVAA